MQAPAYSSPFRVNSPARERDCLTCTHFHGRFYRVHLLLRARGAMAARGRGAATAARSGKGNRGRMMTDMAGRLIIRSANPVIHGTLRPHELI
jgi:hypothetical protein